MPPRRLGIYAVEGQLLGLCLFTATSIWWQAGRGSGPLAHFIQIGLWSSTILAVGGGLLALLFHGLRRTAITLLGVFVALGLLLPAMYVPSNRQLNYVGVRMAASALVLVIAALGTQILVRRT